MVGKNGSGKSSVLHALYGCPKNSNTENFWFSTAVDPINETKKDFNCFVYSYYEKVENSIEERQVVYRRASRPGTKTKRKDPDYWETDRPRKKYKTNSETRFAPIDEKMIYLDFRQELSAYDRYFYFGEIKKNNKAKTKQDFIREASHKINNLFHKGKSVTGNTIYKVHGVPQNKKPIYISNEELNYISYILDVDYSKIIMMSHKFFKIWGTSALVTKKDISYSEANAGSGEYAVINLVHKLVSLNSNSSALVILDEPETSLYPGAQKRLLDFLLKMIAIKKCQIVISTHSEKLTKELPVTAVKAIHYNKENGKSYIQENCSPSTVFEELDISLPYIKIIVEDEAACLLINQIIKAEKINDLKAIHLNSGADSLKKYSIYSDALKDNIKQFYILDGDQNKIDKKKLDLNNTKSSDKDSDEYIQSLVDNICPNIGFPSSKPRRSEKHGSTNNSEEKKDTIKYDSQIKYINFYKNNVYFLPDKTPEDIIFDEEYIVNWLKMSGNKSNVKKLCTNKKKLYYNLCELVTNEKPIMDSYYTIIKVLISNYVKKHSDSSSYKEIVKVLREIDQKCQSTS